MAFLLTYYLHPLYQHVQNWQHFLISGHKATWKGSWESVKEQSQGKGAEAEVVTEHGSVSVGDELQRARVCGCGRQASGLWLRLLSVAWSLAPSSYLYLLVLHEHM